MSTIADRLHKWAVQELNLVSESGSVPDIECFRKLTKGKNKKIWTYVINHVRSLATTNKIKRYFYLVNLKKEIEGKAICSHANDIEQLQSAISKATDKRNYMLKSLSTVKQRLLNLEHEVQATKDEIFEIKQKTSLLEHVIYSYTEKNLHLKNLVSQILSHETALKAYQSVKTCDKTAMVLPYDFLFEDKTAYDEKNSRVQHLINMYSTLLENNFYLRNENNDILLENFQNTIYELKKKDVLLTEFVILLKEICGSNLQYFTSANLQSLSSKDYLQNETQKGQSKALLTRLKCNYVSNSFKTIENGKQIEKLVTVIKDIFKGKITYLESNDLNFEIYTLCEKMAENDSLVVSNRYLEEYLKNMSDRTERVLRDIRRQKFCSQDLTSLIETFYKNADLTFCLLYTFSSASQKMFHNINSLQSFVREQLFESPFPQKEFMDQLRNDFISVRKMTWAYYKKTNTFQSLFSEPCSISGLISSLELQKSLNYQPFQNISALFKNWICLKQKLYSDLMAVAETYVLSSDTNAPELYVKFIAMLENTKISVERAVVFVSEGMTLCRKGNVSIQEWWEQNAQYIPGIEYESKTLKMWIDILSVLSEFEPENCV